MAAVAEAIAGRVENEMRFVHRPGLRRGVRIAHDAILPADILGVVILEVRRRRTRKPPGTRGRVEQGAKRGNRSIMKVGSSRPIAVQRRRLVALPLQADRMMLAKPGLVVVLDEPV